MGHPEKFFERADFSQFRFYQAQLRHGAGWGFKLLEGLQAALQPIMDVLRHQDHFFHDLLLVEKLFIRGLQFLVEFLEAQLKFAVVAIWRPVLPQRITLIYRHIEFASLFDQFAQIPYMAFTPWDLFVEDHAIKSLFWRIGNQFLRQRDVFLSGETQAVDNALDFVLGALNPLRNVHFLL